MVALNCTSARVQLFACVALATLVGGSLTPCSSAVKANINAQLATKTSAALKECEVPNLDALTPADDIANRGVSKFCHRDCIEAISKVAQIWHSVVPRCDYGDFDQLRSLHEQLQLEQYECNPPNQECMPSYLDYQFWATTVEGEACAAHIKSSRNDENTETAQANREALCQGSCVTKIQSFVNELNRGRCGKWPAYIAIKQDVDLLCVTGTSPTETFSAVDSVQSQSVNSSTSAVVRRASDSTYKYCELGYNANHPKIATALDSTRPASEREQLLKTICDPCFHQVQKIKRRNASPLGVGSREPELCITDSVVTTQDGSVRYCLPRFEDADAKTSTINDHAAALCEVYDSNTVPTKLGRCAMLIWATRLHQWDISVTEESKLMSYMRHMCQTNANQVACHAVTQKVVNTEQDKGEWFMQTDPNAGGFCQPSSTTGQCLNPQECQNWAITGDATSCPVACQKAVDYEINSFGCCYNSWRELLLNMSSAAEVATNEKFDRMEYLAKQCCGDNEVCEHGVEGACNPHLFSIRLAIQVPINYGWALSKSLVFNSTIVRDLSKQLGVLPTGIKLVKVERGASEYSTQVTFLAFSASSVEANHLQSLLQSDVRNNVLYIDESSSQYYSDGCDEKSTPQECSFASILSSAPVVTIALLAVAILVLTELV